MTALRTRIRVTAWLGLFAMWLLVFAPLVSQLVASSEAHEPVAELCSETQSHDAGRHHADDAFGACGYCQLLQHHVAMPDVATASPCFTAVVTAAAAPVLSTRFQPRQAFPSGRPRAPPFLV
ncbi:DUF2946 domain-containing protein [Paraburkholderia sp.]|uniref:DUF2946 domain-containing protein n=1 Tax=Paraburkholderia sp. TaxID=1926495 RepID=UPI0023A0EF95|nr:DUF2946 domain-containing protein [Paraburkholderia sp.]MDE1179914.1 DUF2946 domain-containing protein [Paraburkholderia sp.]